MSSALAYIHTQKTLHRDLKPLNIFISRFLTCRMCVCVVWVWGCVGVCLCVGMFVHINILISRAHEPAWSTFFLAHFFLAHAPAFSTHILPTRKHSRRKK